MIQTSEAMFPHFAKDGSSSTFGHRKRVLIAIVRNAFLVMLAYRLRYVTGILTYLLFVSVHYFIWEAIFSSHPSGERINGFNLPEIITYIAVGWISRSLYFSNIDYEIEEIVRTGQISTYLLRPVNFQAMMVANAFGEALFRALFFTIPIGIVICMLFPVSAPQSVTDFSLFLLATGMGFLILAQLNFLIGLLAFLFKSIDGIIRAKYYLAQLCSGLLLPLSFFPEWLRAVVDWLPFKTVAHVPLQLYLGKFSDGEVLSMFLLQFVWLVVLSALCVFAWERTTRHLTLQGG